MTTTTAPVFPPGRYGRRREGRRARHWLTYLLLVPVLAAFLWLAVRLYDQYSDSTNYETAVDSFSVVSDQRVDVVFQVTKADAKAAVCRVQATDQRSSEVGYASVSVPAGGDVRVSYSLKTSARASSVSVLGCSAG